MGQPSRGSNGPAKEGGRRENAVYFDLEDPNDQER